MAIAYIYYTNSMKYVTAYMWEPQTETQRHILQPLRGGNVFANKEVAINFEKGICFYKYKDRLYEAKLSDPTKTRRNLKHQANFNIDLTVDWEEAF